MDWLKQIAPTLATALAGPLAGIAVEAVGKAFGWDETSVEKVSDLLSNPNMSADQLATIKQIEAELIKQERELGFKFAELEVRDRDSARQREIAVKDNVNRNLAYLVILSFLGMVGSVLVGFAKAESVLAGTLIGYVSAKAEQVLAYYFGSTKSSADKTALIAKGTFK